MNAGKSHFFHQEVANLAWCIASQPLLSPNAFKEAMVVDAKWCTQQGLVHQDWLRKLDASPEPLCSFLHQNTKLPLGKVFERYISFWLRESSRFEWIAENIQVEGTTRTIGEFDFLFRDTLSGTSYHMEAACKFYLASKRSKDAGAWIGPSARDRLSFKVDKLHRQLALAGTPEGRETLGHLGIGKVVPMLFVKGYLFHHYRNISRPLAPTVASQSYNPGWWLYLREAEDFFQGEVMYTILPKSDWLADFHIGLQNDDLLPARRVISVCKQLMSEMAQPLMLIQIEAVEGGFNELSRGFIVPDFWPFSSDQATL